MPGEEEIRMKNKVNKYTIQTWMRTSKGVIRQLIIPFSIFQAIRTVMFPTTFDVLLLTLFIGLALAFHYEWL